MARGVASACGPSPKRTSRKSASPGRRSHSRADERINARSASGAGYRHPDDARWAAAVLCRSERRLPRYSRYLARAAYVRRRAVSLCCTPMPTPMPIELSMKNNPLATKSGLGLLTMKSIPPRLPTTGNRYCSQPAAPAGVESTRGGADNVIEPSGTGGGLNRAGRRTSWVGDPAVVVIDSSHLGPRRSV